MAIRWSPFAAGNALDEIERALDKAEPFLQQAIDSLQKARKIENLPGYMDQKLSYVGLKLDRFKEARNSIRQAREQIPEKNIQKEQVKGTPLF